MQTPRSFARLVVGLACLALSAVPAFAAAAKNEDWVDTQGTKFRGSPAALIGPFALFRTGPNTARRLPVTMLRAEDCARFADAIDALPPRATDWAAAKSSISVDLKDRVLRLQDGKLAPASFAGKPEPEIYVLFFVNHGIGPSWDMLGTAMEKFGEISRHHPGFVEGVMVGQGHARGDQLKMATAMNVPWLVTEVLDQAAMSDVRRYQPPAAPFLAIVTRDGTALFTTSGDTKAKVVAEMTRLAEFLDLVRPDNPATWGPLQTYWRAVRQYRFRSGRTPPKLIGDPLKPDILRQHGAESFVATLKVAADGTVQDVTLQAGAKLPDELVNPVRLALVQAVLAPAVDQGKFVAGELAYRFPPAP